MRYEVQSYMNRIPLSGLRRWVQENVKNVPAHVEDIFKSDPEVTRVIIETKNALGASTEIYTKEE